MGQFKIYINMSKGNMLLGHARGKVGSLVFSRADGKQIVRSRAEVVKNPRTESQMVQRIMLNTIAQAYSKMKAITDHSFQGIAEGQQSMSFFMQRNLNNLRTQVAAKRADNNTFDDIYEFSPLKSNFFAVNNYEIAKGTLPEIVVEKNASDLTMSIALSINTYDAFMMDYNLKRGDQITFVAITNTYGTQRDFTFARVILDPHKDNGDEAEMSSVFAQNNTVHYASDRNEGEFRALSWADGKLTFGFGKATTAILGAAVIVSRKNADGTWLRSNATLVQNSDSADMTYSLGDCITLLSDSSLDTLSDWYLNNAGTGKIPTGKPGGGSSSGGTGGGPSQEG